jgi:L-fuculose-phosphate aldolase
MRDLRSAVAESSRRLAASGMTPGTSGNVSARCDGLVAITPTGAALSRLTADDVSVVDLDGRLVDGSLEPTSELELHLRVYRDHGAGAVVHTHAPSCTAVALTRDELPCLHYSMLSLGGTVPVAPYATFGTAELAGNVSSTLAGRTAALMAHHGAITLGRTLAEAHEAMDLLEWACDVFARTQALGGPRLLSADQLHAVANAVDERRYGRTRPPSDG